MDHSRSFPCYCSNYRPDLPLPEALWVTCVIILSVLKPFANTLSPIQLGAIFWQVHFLDVPISIAWRNYFTASPTHPCFAWIHSTGAPGCGFGATSLYRHFMAWDLSVSWPTKGNSRCQTCGHLVVGRAERSSKHWAQFSSLHRALRYYQYEPITLL